MENGQAVTNYRCPISAAHAARAARVEPLWAKIKELGINPPKGLDVSTGLVADFWYPRRMGDDYTGQYDIYLSADKDDKSRWFYAIKGDPNRELPIHEMIAAIVKFPNWKEVRLDGGILPQGD